MKLKRDFFIRDVLTVSEELIGKVLTIKRNNITEQYIIVETEAYCGLVDKAAHAYPNKKTKRTETMFLNGGHLYVYLIYGMYHCLNIVVNKTDIPQAVLIRAVEPLHHTITYKKDIKTNGPGKLSKVLGIDRSFDTKDICVDPDFYITDDYDKPFEISTSKRINIDYAEEAKDYYWRFSMNANKFVSK